MFIGSSTSDKVVFSQRRDFRWLWQKRHKAISEKEAIEAISKGEERFVKGPHQEEPLSLKTQQDLDEFRTFQGQTPQAPIADSPLASQLQELSDSGASFYGRSDDDKKEVGPYGAYNFLTGEMPLSGLEIAFEQVLPRAEVKTKTELEAWAQRADAIADFVSEAPEELRSSHRSRLFRQSLTETSLSFSDAARAAASEFDQTTWESGEAPSFLQPLVSEEGRGEIARELLADQSIKHLDSALALVDATREKGLNDREFLQKVHQHAIGSEDKLGLERALGRRVFGSLAARVDKALKETKDGDEKELLWSKLFNTGLKNPKLKSSTELALESISSLNRKKESNLVVPLFDIVLREKNTPQARGLAAILKAGEDSLFSEKTTDALLDGVLQGTLSSQKLYETLDSRANSWKKRILLAQKLTPELYPGKVERIDGWVEACPEEKRAECRDRLMLVALEEPKLSSSGELLNHLGDEILNSDRNRPYVNKVYKWVLSSATATKNAHTERILELCEAKKDGKAALNDQTQRTLLKEAAKSNLTDEELIETAAGSHLPWRDRVFLAGRLGAELLPEKLKLVNSWLSSAPKENRDAFRDRLMVVALEAPELSTPQEFMAYLSDEVLNSKGHDSYVSRMYRGVLASDSVPKNSYSSKIVELCSKVDDKGKVILSDGVQRTLLREALDPKLSSGKLLELASQVDGSWKERLLIAKELTPELLPEKVKLIDDWLTATPEEKVETHRDRLMMVALEKPEFSAPQDFVNHLGDEILNSKSNRQYVNKVYRHLLAADSVEKNPRAARFLKLCERKNDKGELLIGESSQRALLKAAINPALTDTELVTLVASAHGNWKERLLIAEDLAPDLLPDQTKLIDKWLSAASSDDRETHRGRLMMVAMEKPELTKPKDYLLHLGDEILSSKSNRGYVNRVYKDLLANGSVEKNSHSKSILALCELKDENGNSKLGDLSQRKLLKAAAEAELSDAEFIELIAKAHGNWTERKLIAREFAAELLPATEKKVKEWLTATPEDKKPKYLERLMIVALDKPEFSKPRDFMSYLGGELLNSSSNRAYVNGVYKDLLRAKQVGKNSHASKLLELCELKNEAGEARLADTTQRVLLDAAMASELSDEALAVLVSGEHKTWKERILIAQEMGPTLVSRQVKLIDQWLTGAPEEKRKEYRDRLMMVALEKPEFSEAEDLLAHLGDEILNSKNNQNYVNGMYREVLKSDAVRKNPQAEAILKLSEAKDGEGKARLGPGTQRTLLKLALSSDFDNQKLAPLAAGAYQNWKERLLLAQELAPVLLPEKLALIDGWLAKVPEDKRKEYRDRLLIVALEKPEFSSPEEFLNHLSTEILSSDRNRAYVNKIYEGVLQQELPELFHLQALRKTWESSEERKSPISNESTRRLLMQFALDSRSVRYPSNVEFFKAVLEKVEGPQQDVLASALGSSLLEGMEEAESIRTKIEAGEYSRAEIVEILEAVQTVEKPELPEQEISIEEDLIVVGDEVLEVDL